MDTSVIHVSPLCSKRCRPELWPDQQTSHAHCRHPNAYSLSALYVETVKCEAMLQLYLPSAGAFGYMHVMGLVQQAQNLPGFRPAAAVRSDVQQLTCSAQVTFQE